MAEFVMKDLVQKAGPEDQFEIASAATSSEEIGNLVYPPTCRKLAEHGINCAGRAGEIADSWYTGDFDATWHDVLEGCLGLLEQICGSAR